MEAAHFYVGASSFWVIGGNFRLVGSASFDSGVQVWNLAISIVDIGFSALKRTWETSSRELKSESKSSHA